MTDVRIGPDRQVTLHFALKLDNGDVVDSTFDKQPATCLLYTSDAADE